MSSTIWKSSPSSSPKARHAACSASGTRATQSASPTAAPNRQPVLSLCSVGSSGAVPVMSRYWPPIIPSVASASSRATCVVSYDVARRNASASSASPARMPAAAPLLVVVERGQVVVDERERVHELERAARGECVLRLDARGLRGSEADHRADAL